MRKEVFFAIVAGISIGLVIAFGAWKASQMIKKPKITLSDKRNTPPQNNISLSISNLYDYDVLTDSPYKLSGISKPKSEIVVSTDESDFYTISNDDGSFEIEIELVAGLSEIRISEPSLNSTQKIPVVFSSEFKKYLEPKIDDISETENTATDEAEAKNSADIIRERIKSELSTKSLKKTAYIGTITDISSGTIQIKSVQGDIKQMSLSSDATYINTLKKNTEVKATDLAIGDYIIAMGFVNGNKVLDAKRILIGSLLVENKFEAKEITIETLTKTKINDIPLPKNWVGPNIKELEVGQKIIIVGAKNEDKFDIRTIFVIE